MDPRDTGYLLKMINDRLKAKADANLKALDLTFSQSRVLAVLHSKGGMATQKELEDCLEVSHPTIVGIVSRMEQSGYVTTWIDPKVQRSKMVQLTQKANDLETLLGQQINEQEHAMLKGMTPDQVRQLKELLIMVYNNLE